ncbi:WD40 repeat-like protein, partial [Exidia glandulosa HHB12029]
MSYPYATHVWRTRGCKRIATLKGHTDSVTCIAFTDDTCSPASVLVATGSADQTARVWCARDQRVLAIFNQHEDCVVSVAWTPDAKMLASASWDNTVRLWCLTSHACLAVLPHGARVPSLCFVPSSGRRGSVLLTGCDDASLRLWDAESTDSAVLASAIEAPVECVVFSKDCCFLATISGNTIAVWRPRS